MKIIYYASDDTMGDTTVEDCERFREWAREKLEDEFPNDDIEVSSEKHLDEIWMDPDNEEDIDRESDVEMFARGLWERMKW